MSPATLRFLLKNRAHLSPQERYALAHVDNLTTHDEMVLRRAAERLRSEYATDLVAGTSIIMGVAAFVFLSVSLYVRGC